MLIHPNLRNVTFCNVAPSLISQNLKERMCSVQISLLVVTSPSHITCFDIKIIHQSIRTTCSHVSCCHHCHYCRFDFVLFHNVTCYIDSLLSRIHVNTIDLLNIMCTLVATCMMLVNSDFQIGCHDP
jgi:hypothetical protein